MISKTSGSIKKVLRKLNVVGDSPHRVAFGFAVGIFAGVVPGVGPVFAVFGAWALRASKTAAVTGAVLTNTWINLLTFPAAVSLGAFTLELDKFQIGKEWDNLIKDFTWARFRELVFQNGALAIFTGYLIIGLACAFVSYILVRIFLSRLRRANTPDSSIQPD